MSAPPPPPPGGVPSAPRPPLPSQQPAPPPPQAAPVAARRLVLHYAGQRFEVNKDRFVIGRGKKASDLTIKDPNVSRAHAMVEAVDGQFFMVDMGSTNGVLYQGQRVQRQPINPGDTFTIVKYELRFDYE